MKFAGKMKLNCNLIFCQFDDEQNKKDLNTMTKT